MQRRDRRALRKAEKAAPAARVIPAAQKSALRILVGRAIPAAQNGKSLSNAAKAVCGVDHGCHAAPGTPTIKSQYRGFVWRPTIYSVAALPSPGCG